jgi:site-specific recombinase XerD
MKLSTAIDEFIRDWWSQGRMTSPATEGSYRAVLWQHADDVGNRDPRYVGRSDIKATLARWSNPNTQRVCYSILATFYDWSMEEGYRKDNPARQVRRPRKRPPAVYRLTLVEVLAMLDAVQTTRERRAIYLGICAGLRNAELRGLRGVHFRRPGFVWVSRDISKGGRERWVPVVDELAPVVREIQAWVRDEEYVLPAQRWRDPPHNRRREELALRPCSSQALRTLVMDVATRAGIQAHVHPHLLRHAYAEHIARHAGTRNAQFLLGHAGIATTEIYLGKPTLDDLAGAVSGFRFRITDRTDVLGGPRSGETAEKATTGIEPV